MLSRPALRTAARAAVAASRTLRVVCITPVEGENF